MSINPDWYLALGVVLFSIGALGVLVRRNVLVMFMCVELMLNAANLTFVTFARTLHDIGGQVLVFFVLVVAAAEVVVGPRDRGGHLPPPGQRHRRRPPRDEGLSAPMLHVTYLIILLPLVGFAVQAVAGRAPRRPAGRGGGHRLRRGLVRGGRRRLPRPAHRQRPGADLHPEPVDVDPRRPAPGPRQPATSIRCR